MRGGPASWKGLDGGYGGGQAGFGQAKKRRTVFCVGTRMSKHTWRQKSVHASKEQ